MNRCVQAWLDGIGRYGWSGAHAAQVAADAGLHLAELMTAGDRYDALGAFAAACDEATREAITSAGSTRDRLFDAFMAGFDLLQANRAASVALLTSNDPAVPAILAPALLCRLRRIADGCGVDLRLPLGPLRLMTLGVIHARALRAWRHDRTADMAAVMAQLDRDLARAEAWAEGKGEFASLPIGRLLSVPCPTRQPSPDRTVE